MCVGCVCVAQPELTKLSRLTPVEPSVSLSISVIYTPRHSAAFTFLSAPPEGPLATHFVLADVLKNGPVITKRQRSGLNLYY